MVMENNETPYERRDEECWKLAMQILHMGTRYQEDTVHGEGRDPTTYEHEPPFSLPAYTHTQSVQRDDGEEVDFRFLFDYFGNFNFTKQ